MKRLHVNLGVTDLERSIRFYSSLFGAAPTVLKDDYAQWMLDDPRVNFAITSRGKKGIDHLGIQVESRDELDEAHARLNSAQAPRVDQGAVICCYAKSEKHWTCDPEGIAWETFLTTGESTVYGGDRRAADVGACCDRPFFEGGTASLPCCAGETRIAAGG